MNNLAIQKQFGESGSRIGEIIWLAAAVPGELETEMLDDILDQLDDEELTPHPSLAWLLDCPKAYREDTFTLHEWMIEMGKLGFIIDAHYPVPHFTGEDITAWNHSWGNYFTNLIYVESLEEAPALVAAWAKERHEAHAQQHLDRLAASAQEAPRVSDLFD